MTPSRNDAIAPEESSNPPLDDNPEEWTAASADAKDAGPLFHCSGCGQCCTMWQVFIDKRRGDALLAKDWVQQRLAVTQTQFEPLDERGYYLPFTQAQACVFLDDDQLCAVEKHEGRLAKPNDCLRFPFAAVPWADGTLSYDATAACKTVAETLLLAFSDIQPSAHEQDAVVQFLQEKNLSPYGEPPQRFPERIKRYPPPLGWWRPLRWQTVRLLERQLKTAFTLPDVLPWTALRLARQRLTLPHPQRTPPPDWSQALRQGEPPAWDTPKNWLILALLLRRPYGWFSVWQWTINGVYHDPKLLGTEAFLPVAQVRAVHWDLASVGRTAVLAFLFAIVRRRMALAYGYRWLALLSQAVVALLLVHWYARVFAAINNQTEVTLSEVHLAIRTVERYYTGHQPRFPALFDYNLLWAWLYAWAL